MTNMEKPQKQAEKVMSVWIEISKKIIDIYLFLKTFFTVLFDISSTCTFFLYVWLINVYALPLGKISVFLRLSWKIFVLIIIYTGGKTTVVFLKWFRIQ